MNDKKQVIKQPSEVPKTNPKNVPRKKGVFKALVLLLIVSAASFASGVYVQRNHGEELDRLFSRAKQTPAVVQEDTTLDRIESAIMCIGQIRKGIKEKIEAMKDKVQLEQNSLTVSVVVEGSDPNSAECKILSKKISSLNDQLKTLESFDESLESQDLKLRKLYAMVKADLSRIDKNPEMMDIVKLSEDIIQDYIQEKEFEQLDRMLREGLVSTKDWEMEISKGGPQ